MAVAVVEAGPVGAQASSANAGSLHAQIPHDPFRTLGEGWARNYQPAIRLLIASLGLPMPGRTRELALSATV